MNRLYAFLYDDILSAPSFQRTVANIETRCSVLGIQGRASRLAIFRSAKEVVEGMVKDGAQTIVVVGNDKTLEKVMWFLPDLPVTIGYIPVCEPFGIAGLLGIPSGDAACDIVAARRVETLDIGKINDRYFLTDVYIEDSKATVQVDGKFTIGAIRAGTISIRNLGGVTAQGVAIANAKDGWLDLGISPMVDAAPSRFPWAISSPKREETCVRFKEGRIQSQEPIDILVDGHQFNGFSFEVSIIPNALKIITGRNKRLEPVSSTILPSE